DPIVPNTTASFTATAPYDVALNFTGGWSGGTAPQPLDPSDRAGLYPVRNWNNIGGNLSDTAYIAGIPLNDVDGKATPVTVHYAVCAHTVRYESGRGEDFTIDNDPITTLHVRSENFQDWLNNPTFRRGTSTDRTARDLCNYVQFDNVQPVNGTITLDARSEGF